MSIDAVYAEKSNNFIKAAGLIILIEVVTEAIIMYFILPILEPHVSPFIANFLDPLLLIIITTPLIAKFVLQPYVLAKIDLINQIREQADLIKFSEERYSLVSKNTNDGFFDWDYENNTAYYSEKWKQIIPDTYPISEADQISSLTWIHNVHEDDLVNVFKSLINSISDEKNENDFYCEFRIHSPNDEFTWVQLRWSVIFKDHKPKRVIGTITVVNDRKMMEQKLLANATLDTLTGLFNRSVLNNKLQQIINEFEFNIDSHYALLLLDLDKFKQVNDTLGHNAGDKLLIEVAKRIQSVCDNGDIICRLGGDEFAIIHQYDNNALDLSNRILDISSEYFELENSKITCTFSIGVTYISRKYKTTESILRDADIAMYKAKLDHKMKVREFESYMQNESDRIFILSQDIKHSIEKNELIVAYQPIYNIKNNTIIGAETILKWHHPKYGEIAQMQLMNIATSSGFITELLKHTLSTACIYLSNNHELMRKDFFISINLSGVQIKNCDINSIIHDKLSEYHSLFNQIQIELNDTSSLDKDQNAQETLTQLANSGISISLDHFGTEYTSINLLYKIPFKFIKIDESCIINIKHNAQSQKIFDGIFNLAKSINAEIIVNGVTNKSQNEYLTKKNVTYAQGNLYSTPLYEMGLIKLLQKQLDKADKLEIESAN